MIGSYIYISIGPSSFDLPKYFILFTAGPIIVAFSFKKRKKKKKKNPIYSNLYVCDCWIRWCVQTC